MKTLRSLEEVGVNLSVLLRLDTDLPINEGQILDNSRLKKSIPTIRYLLDKGSKLVIVGHLGRPAGIDEKLSLRPVYLELMSLLESEQNVIESVFVDDIKDENKIGGAIQNNQIIFVENLRFWKEEEEGETGLFKGIKKYVSILVNDAFAVAHRRVASVIIHREMETYYGFSFVEEVEKIGSILDKKEKPITVILGGAKEDKLKYIDDLLKVADHILIGGKLPKLIESENLKIESEKIKIGNLREDKLDLSDEDIKKFDEVIKQSKTVVWSGAMGFYEKEDARKGTEEIAKSVAEIDGYKIIAGGDTSASIKDLGLKNRIDFICSGGGVMLELLTKGDLPAWN